MPSCLPGVVPPSGTMAGNLVGTYLSGAASFVTCEATWAKRVRKPESAGARTALRFAAAVHTAPKKVSYRGPTPSAGVDPQHDEEAEDVLAMRNRIGNGLPGVHFEEYVRRPAQH